MNDLTPKENPMLYWFSKFGDFLVLSILWLCLCLPVVTFVPACIAMYDSVAHCIHGTEEGSVRRFFCTLKNELLRGILLSILWLCIGALLTFGFNILYQMGQQNPNMAAYSLVYLVTMLLPLGVLTWMIPVQSRFEHGFFGLLRASIAYAVGHLPTTLLLLLIFAVAMILVLVLPALVLLLPCVTVTVQCYFVERVFKKYIPQEEEEDDG